MGVTPGRHLRFRPADVVEFLVRYGFDVPPSLRRDAAAEGYRAPVTGEPTITATCND